MYPKLALGRGPCYVAERHSTVAVPLTRAGSPNLELNDGGIIFGLQSS